MKTLLVRIHGMNISPKFGVRTVDRDDPFISHKREAQGMTRGQMVHEVAPCRTDRVVGELMQHGMNLTNIVLVMSGPKKATPVLYLTYSDEGTAYVPQFNCTEDEVSEVLAKYELWLANILMRSWESGQLYQNTGNVSICVVGALKLDGKHSEMYISDLLDETENSASAS
jgi:hypothetical protein